MQARGASRRGRRADCPACETYEGRTKGRPATESGQRYVKKERRRKEQKQGSTGLYAGLPGCPHETSPSPARIPRKGLKRWFHLRPSWPQSWTLRDQGQGTGGLSSSGEVTQADFPGGPHQTQRSRQLSLPYREDGGRPRDGPGPAQGHTVTKALCLQTPGHVFSRHTPGSHWPGRRRRQPWPQPSPGQIIGGHNRRMEPFF